MWKRIGMILLSLTLPLLTLNAGSVNSQNASLSLGASYINQTANGEKQPPLVTNDVSFLLSAPDAYAEYRVQFHQDEVWRQTPKGTGLERQVWKSLSPFYSLDIISGSRVSGGGILLSQIISGGKRVSLSALYREGGYGFEGKIQRVTDSICGSIGYSYDKYRDIAIWGPSVEIGARW